MVLSSTDSNLDMFTCNPADVNLATLAFSIDNICQHIERSFLRSDWCAVGSEVDTTARAQAHLAKALNYLGSKSGAVVGSAQILFVFITAYC